MATKVKQQYRAGEGRSVTKRNGFVTKVSVWTTGTDQPKTQTVEFPEALRVKGIDI